MSNAVVRLFVQGGIRWVPPPPAVPADASAETSVAFRFVAIEYCPISCRNSGMHEIRTRCRVHACPEHTSATAAGTPKTTTRKRVDRPRARALVGATE
mmetsp:Transcript_4218/g.15531  ORF Transcript_4218/g.15531 Transcript_4218/m.15531 type:complete len:98 (-) Transcript_4218:23-316(-)